MTKTFDPVELTIFASRLNAVCDEMGAQLCQAAFSPNIRDRLDYSCAIFDAEGLLCAQAAHIPVHLGSMAFAMADIVETFNWSDGDTVILNDPFKGGTHLPDVTLISPVFVRSELCGFVADRAHHADIGGSAPGSMPLSTHIDQEGELISPRLLIKAHELDQDWYQDFTQKLNNPKQSSGDFNAQIAANDRGRDRLINLILSIGSNKQFFDLLIAVNEYGERLSRSMLASLPQGTYTYSDAMESDGQGNSDISINVSVKVYAEYVELDFNDTHPQVSGNINCPLSVTAAAVYYVFRCLMPKHTPACQGIFTPIIIKAPSSSVINAQYPAATAAGNVETSTRIVDVVIGAMAKAIPDKLPAMSYGSMNNLAMGFHGDSQQAPWDYYETIGGGMGAGIQYSGLSAVQAHMTNTLNTPVEVIESNYPLFIRRYGVRRNSGGQGCEQGGDGIVREYEFTHAATLTLLTERRSTQPKGFFGGEDAKAGCNLLNGQPLPAKCEIKASTGDVLSIKTPGGGGYGKNV